MPETNYHSKTPNSLHNAFYNHAKVLYVSKKFNETASYIERLLSEKKIDATSSYYGDFLFLLGVCYLKKFLFKDAEKIFREALNSDKNNFKAAYYLGLVFEEQGKFKEAIHVYKLAYTVNPQFNEAKNKLIEIQKKLPNNKTKSNFDNSKNEYVKTNVPRQNVPRQNVPRQNVPRQNVPRQNAPRQNVPQPYKPQSNNSPEDTLPGIPAVRRSSELAQTRGKIPNNVSETHANETIFEAREVVDNVSPTNIIRQQGIRRAGDPGEVIYENSRRRLSSFLGTWISIVIILLLGFMYQSGKVLFFCSFFSGLMFLYILIERFIKKYTIRESVVEFNVGIFDNISPVWLKDLEDIKYTQGALGGLYYGLTDTAEIILIDKKKNESRSIIAIDNSKNMYRLYERLRNQMLRDKVNFERILLPHPDRI